jgi:ribosome maturation factor RimP
MLPRDESLTQLLEEPVAALGYELLGLEFVSAGKHSTLRLYIDSDAGIDVDDCAKVSRQGRAILAVEDPVPGQYSLEVSSPGLDRPLFTPAHFEQFVGEAAELKLLEPDEDQRHFKGEIVGYQGGSVELRLEDGSERRFEIANIGKANLVPAL